MSLDHKVIIYSGSGFLVILGIYLWLGIKKSYGEGKALPVNVSVVIWVTDIFHLFLVILSAIYSIWLLPINRIVSLVIGSTVSVAGFIIMILGMIEFRHFKKISGLNVGKLIKTGIYRWSRNPQYIGWFILLLGISITGRSGFSLLLTIVLVVAIHLYNVLLEEPYLEKKFGKEYRIYKSTTPRYIGLPKF